MKSNENTKSTLGGWLLARFKSGDRSQPRLELLERITLAPKQSLALIEAEGRRLLVATSPEGAPTFYALDGPARPRANRQSGATRLGARVSW
ncbi:MAG: flagellar biosynthetic protein FliO [Terracidiphilus sp.]|jgi:flagellar biogenesis protein FliO